MYAAYSYRGFKKKEFSIKQVVETRLRKLTVNVIPVLGAGDAPALIDFETAALLPLWCKIHIRTLVAFYELVKLYVRQVKFALLKVTIYGLSEKYQARVDLKGLEVDAVHLKHIYQFDTSNIPLSTKKLEFTLSSLPEQVDLTHLTMLTHVDMVNALFRGGRDWEAPQVILPQLVTTLRVPDCFPIEVSPLPQLQHYIGMYNDNLPWRQIKTAAVDYIPNGARCDLLEEITIFDTLNFKTIHCPNLRKVVMYEWQTGNITDMFTHVQLSQLKEFRGGSVLFNDLTLLRQVEVLHVQYNDTLSEDTPLSPHLVELHISSRSPVEGVPHQLTVFEYKKYQLPRLQDISVRSPTLKRLLIELADKLTVDCPHLKELHLRDIESVVECNTPAVLKFCLRDSFTFRPPSPFPFETLLNLRQLHLLFHRNNPYCGHITIQRLESVTLEGVKLHLTNLSADEVYLKNCSFHLPGKPTIKARVLTALNTDFGNGIITCQELTCDTIEQIPSSVERVRLEQLPSDPSRLFWGCDKLTSVSINSAETVGDELVIPTSVVHLALPVTKFRFQGTKRFKKPQKLEFFQWGDTVFKWQLLPPPKGITGEFKKFGSKLWCRPDKLKLRRPFGAHPEK